MINKSRRENSDISPVDHQKRSLSPAGVELIKGFRKKYNYEGNDLENADVVSNNSNVSRHSRFNERSLSQKKLSQISGLIMAQKATNSINNL